MQYTHLGYSFGVPGADGSPHPGWDYNYADAKGDDLGKPVYPCMLGKVVYSGERAHGYGNMVVVDHENGWYSKYAHLLDIKVKVGDKVNLDTILGTVGSTGASTSPHLHFELCDKFIWDQGPRYWPKGRTRQFVASHYIDPAEMIDKFTKEVRVLLVAKKSYRVDRVVDSYKKMGVTLKIDRKTYDGKVQWDDQLVSDQWWNKNIAHLASGYDIVAVVTEPYKRKRSKGYAIGEHYNGMWRCFIEDTGKPRKSGNSPWNWKNQVAGTLAHEICHCMHYATGIEDRTHAAEREGTTLDLRFDISKFNGWHVDGKVRVFKWKSRRKLKSINGQLKYVRVQYPVLQMRVVPPSHVKLLKNFYSPNIKPYEKYVK